MNLFTPVVIERTDSRLIRHGSVMEARAEAERLARANPGKEFAVYSPIVIVRVPLIPVREERIDGGVEADLPF